MDSLISLFSAMIKKQTTLTSGISKNLNANSNLSVTMFGTNVSPSLRGDETPIG